MRCRLTVWLLPPANEVWGKVIFSEACVKNSVHRGEVCLSACWDTTPPLRTREAPLPRSRACMEILSTSGRYASYLNAILFRRRCKEVTFFVLTQLEFTFSFMLLVFFSLSTVPRLCSTS